MADAVKVEETDEIDAVDAAEVDADETVEIDGEKDLRDEGKKALDAMKAKWRTERDARKAAEAKLVTPPAAEKDDAGKPDLEALRTQAREEAKAESLKERALDRIEAKAAKLFNDPEDARAYLARSVDDFIDGQSIDNEAILEALTDLLSKKPYLGVTQGEEKRFKGSGDQGAKGTAGKPQFTRQDVEKWAAAGEHGKIEAARIGGQLNKILGITT